MQNKIILNWGITIFRLFSIMGLVSMMYSGFAQCNNYESENIRFSINSIHNDPEYSDVYILTDNNDIVLELSSDAEFAPRSTNFYKIYAVNYRSNESFQLATSQSIASISHSCYSISSSLSIQVCATPVVDNTCYTYDSDPILFTINSSNNNSDYTDIYALTDDNGTVVQLSSNSSFTAQSEGYYNIYGINYKNDESLLLVTGQNISAISHSCYSVSSPLSIRVCVAPVTSNPCYAYDTDEISFTINATNNNVAYTDIYALTDNSGLVIELSNSSSFSAQSVGDYKIYSINYRSDESLQLATGQNINTISNSCYSLSPAMNIEICAFPSDCYTCDGGTVSFSSIGGDVDATFTTSYFVTNTSGIIKHINSTPTFSDIEAGNYFVFSVSYQTSSGISNFSIENDIDNISSSCMDLSSPYAFKVCDAGSLDALQDRTICDGEEVYLIVPSGLFVQYRWSTGSASSTIQVSPTQTTNYSVTVTSASGCTASKTVTVSIANPPDFDLGDNLLTCNGQYVTINGPANMSRYQWSSGQSSKDITVNPAETTVYTLTVTDFNGCTASDVVIVAVDTGDNPANQIFDICRNDQIELSAGLNGTTYQWNTGSNNASIIVNPSLATNYSVTISNSNGCTTVNTFQVNVSDRPSVSLPTSATICQGEVYNIDLNQNYESVVWSTGDITRSIDVSPSTNAVYQVTVTNASGCTSSTSMGINVLSTQTLNLGADRTACRGFSVNLSSDVDAQQYVWSTSETTKEITVNPQVATEYRLTITNVNGCTSTDNIFVDVTSECNLCNLYNCEIACTQEIGILEFSRGAVADPSLVLQYMLVDMDATILEITTNEFFNIQTSGTYFIYSYSYSPDPSNILPTVGGQLDNVSGECLAISEPYVVKICPETLVASMVWNDLNGDGQQGVNEPKVPNMTVDLYDCNTNQLVASTITDSNGAYSFEGIPVGQYYIIFGLDMLDDAYIFTLLNQGNDATDNDANAQGLTACFTVNLGSSIETISAGIAFPANIGNFIWEDINGNGIQEASEPGVGNITIQLVDVFGNVVRTTTSDTEGYYLFRNVQPGDYYIRVVNLNEYSVTFPNRGISNTKDSEIDNSNGLNTTTITTLLPNETDLDWDIGLYKCANIGERVWLDDNENDVWDVIENGIDNLVVNLWRQNIDFSYTIYETTYTGHKPGTPSDDGYFNFCAPPGKYYVEVVMPPYGLVQTIQNVGNDEYKDSDLTNANGIGTTASFTVLSGDTKNDIAAGFYHMSEIGDRVWLDADRDGIQDDNEPGIPEISVKAFNLFGDIVAESTTDYSGSYNLDYLKKEDYYIEFEIPDGYMPTRYQTGNDDAMDSDVDDIFGKATTNIISARPGEALKRVDAGIVTEFQAILPLDWYRADVYREEDYNDVTWSTLNEINVDHFIVERKSDNQEDFEAIGHMPSKRFSLKANHYDFRDYDILESGTYYYRIQSVDIDGYVDYSKIMSIKVEKQANFNIEIYPNPNFGVFEINLKGSDETPLEVKIFALDGRLIKTLYNSGDTDVFDKNVVRIELDNNSLAGMYICEITTDKNQYIKKVTVH